MEEQHAHAKRKHYDQHTYARLLADLTQLMDEVPKLRPDRDAWDIEGDWAPTGTIHFIDARHQPLFEALRHFDCRSIKLVNLDRPAARMTFYRKHRYWLLKDGDLPLDQKRTQIQAFIDELDLKSQRLEASLESISLLKRDKVKAHISDYRHQIESWRQIRANPGQYELAISNYSRQHMYVTLNYKYPLDTGGYANQQEHLLNTQRDRLGNITQVRYNLIFVDTTEILREHPYQNREVEAYLRGFPIQAPAGGHTLYARLRVDTPFFPPALPDELSA